MNKIKGDLMKKILVSLLAVSTFGVSLMAYGQEHRVKDMQMMETSMVKIQKGLLRNNKDMVVEGVDSLKDASKNVEVAPKGYKDYNSIFAKQQSKNIVKYAEKIKENILANHKHAASKSYVEVIGECISCHNKIRKWN
jgi:cytochrome c556